MVILGLGSNVGDRLANLRQAIHCLKQLPALQVIAISPVYLSDALLPDNAPLDWDLPHLNCALRCETTLEPLALLQEIKNIEQQAGRDTHVGYWGPRILDIDILAWDERQIENEVLTIPHKGLLERPFALWPLADVAACWRFPLTGAAQGKTAAEIVEKWGSRFSGKAPLHTHQLYQRLDTPQLVGIINVTPDSFSDGGKFLHAEKALEQTHYLIHSGAEIIDIGAESTAPHASTLSPEQEWTRLQPVIALIKEAQDDFLITPKLSIDTRYPETAKKALGMGVDWINDVTGLSHPAMRELIAQTTADCVIMHHLSIPASRDHVLPRDQNTVTNVYEWAARQLDALEKEGISRNRLIIDPGIGFGKTAEQSVSLIHHIDTFKTLQTRLLIGHSRKSFLSLFTQYPSSDRDIETLATSIYLAHSPIEYLRIHQVEMCARAFRVLRGLSANE